ncbi:hypothetical protein EWB00_003646 [Schistosoma japonicum]|uniref:Uncharacterized protein n=1 Tax=Schistosoma japonicum TaxID=6182 RepID=A0A4Z2DW31_SCHJA|nr:hypothetical protein EWB00_003646 [Schistosoma japonicum]
MVRASPSEQYDKLGLLSNSYSFHWETNSFNSAFNKTNIDTTNVAYNFKLYEKAKYKSFLLIFYKTTKHKIEKTFNNLQRHQHYHHDDHRVIHNTNYAYNKGEDTMSIPNNVQQATDKKQCRISNEMNIKYTQFHNASNDNTLQSLNSSSSSLGRIVHHNGANVYNLDNDDTFTLNGGIQCKTISKICQQIAMQLESSLHTRSNNVHNHHVIDNAGILRQLLTNGMMPTKLFLLNYTHPLALDMHKSVKLMNSSSIINDNNQSTCEFYQKLNNLPDQLKQSIGYMEVKHLKQEFNYLTQTI